MISLLRRVYYRFNDFFGPGNEQPSLTEKEKFEFPEESESVSVELALNSRCTSDYDGNPKKFHWGMFDQEKEIKEDQVKKVIDLAKIPRFTQRKVEIRAERNILTFIIERQKDGIEMENMMVESGMQQQMVALACTALGIGNVLRNLGKDGMVVSDEELATISMELGAMKPGYGGSFWTDQVPKGNRSYRKDNLPEPKRNGKTPLFSVLPEIKTENCQGEGATIESIGQLLWAARGRTPHYYKSRPWGMTIPTWGGEQGITSLYVILDGTVWKYVNRKWFGWAHSLKKLKTVNAEEIANKYVPYNVFIILGKNEDFGRAYWEVGYQFLNVILQAKSLGISYRAILLDENGRNSFRRVGIKDPLAAMLLKYQIPPSLPTETVSQ